MDEPLHPYRTPRRDIPEGWDSFIPGGMSLRNYGPGYLNKNIAVLLSPGDNKWRVYRMDRGAVVTPCIKGVAFDEGYAAIAYATMLDAQGL